MNDPIALPPRTSLLRLHQIIGNPRSTPPVPAIIPVSKSTWWKGVQTGRFPKPIKLGPRITTWSAEAIYALVRQGAV